MSLDVNIEPEEFNTTELHNSIKEVAKIKGIDDFEYQVEFACEQNSNYIANLFRVFVKEISKEREDVEDESADNESDEKDIGDTEKDKQEFSVIVKTLINTTRQELFSEFHKREVFVYNEVIPKFISIQNNIDESNVLILPECILSITDKGKEVIVLEDLQAKKFVTDGKLAKFERLDYLQVRLVMSELAKLHALSYIFERKDPESYKKITSHLPDLLFQENFLNKSKLRNYFNDAFNAAVKVVTNDEIKNKLNKIEPKLLNILRKYVEPKKNNVLCHGDCWINNMLFKHEERKQSKICFLDFQTMRYANPITDISYFIYLCTDSTFRSEYFDTLLNVYYDSFKSYLNLFDVDVKEIYSREDCMNDVKENTPFGILMAMIEMKIVTTNHHSTYSVIAVEDGLPSASDVDGEIKLFIIRINDLVKEMAENGVLDRLLDEINTL